MSTVDSRRWMVVGKGKAVPKSGINDMFEHIKGVTSYTRLPFVGGGNQMVVTGNMVRGRIEVSGSVVSQLFFFLAEGPGGHC